MNNKEKYINTFSVLHPSDESVERVINMSNRKRKIILAPLAAALCVIMLVALTFGNGLSKPTITPTPEKPDATLQDSVFPCIQSILVPIVSATDKGIVVEQKPLEMGVETELGYRLEIFDLRGKTEAEKNETVQQNTIFVWNMPCLSPGDEVKLPRVKGETHENVFIRQSVNNPFMIKPDENKTVKSFSMKTGTEYWQLNYYDTDAIAKPPYQIIKGCELTVEGVTFNKIMQENRQSGNDTFEVNLEHGEKMCNAINANPDIDLKAFDDKVTFRLDYTDGTTEESVIKISFNADGTLTATSNS